MRLIPLLCLVLLISCKNRVENPEEKEETANQWVLYAKGFEIEKLENGILIIQVKNAWPGSDSSFKYVLIPKTYGQKVNALIEDADAVIPIPVDRIIVTSTTHIPALEALGVEERLVGFPETRYVSSEKTRRLIDDGQIDELGSNELLNTEITISLEPDLLVGFGIDGQNKAYRAIESTGIPLVYNGDWTEETPLGKAEWIKFFAPFFELEDKADRIFNDIEASYLESKKLAQSDENKPTVLSGALYKDIWYLPAGQSWAAKFIEDANANYIWKDSEGSGSLSLNLETVLSRADNTDFWISPSQFTTYREMEENNSHYQRFRAFRQKKVFTFAGTRGATGGLLYYELAPSRPDLVLRDLIKIFHPQLLPEYEPFFFKPLE